MTGCGTSPPRSNRAPPALLADYQKRLVEQGVELRWPPGA